VAVGLPSGLSADVQGGGNVRPWNSEATKVPNELRPEPFEVGDPVCEVSKVTEKKCGGDLLGGGLVIVLEVPIAGFTWERRRNCHGVNRSWRVCHANRGWQNSSTGIGLMSSRGHGPMGPWICDATLTSYSRSGAIRAVTLPSTAKAFGKWSSFG